jgi:acyl dehydratase
MPTVFQSPTELPAAAGRALGVSDWIQITQERIDQFAEATGDHQWIHCDPEKARTGPFGATIAHGYLTSSLASLFLSQIVQVRGVRMGINYGADRLRFPAPVRVGSRVRGSAELVEAETAKDGSVQAKIRLTVEIDGGDRPACVIDTISRYYPA